MAGLGTRRQSDDAALETFLAYRERYAPVAELAGLRLEFDALGELKIADRYEGTGSTDF